MFENVPCMGSIIMPAVSIHGPLVQGGKEPEPGLSARVRDGVAWLQMFQHIATLNAFVGLDKLNIDYQ